MTELLAVQNLEVCYHSERGIVQALDGVSLTIAKGEVVGLVGESGCGKSTLVRAILGVLPHPAAELRRGTIRFAGRDLVGMNAIERSQSILGRRITLVPQDPFGSFNPLFTIGQQMLDDDALEIAARPALWDAPLALRTCALSKSAMPARSRGHRRDAAQPANPEPRADAAEASA